MMDIFEELNEENFTLFAIRHYDNPQCTSTEEFYEDMRRFRYLKRLLKRYYKNGELRERLILNHLIVLNNLFGVSHAIRLLEYKIEEAIVVVTFNPNDNLGVGDVKPRAMSPYFIVGVVYLEELNDAHDKLEESKYFDKMIGEYREQLV